MAGDVKWIKVAVDIFDSVQIKALERYRDADALILLYLKLLCNAHKRSAKGVFSVADIKLDDAIWWEVA